MCLAVIHHNCGGLASRTQSDLAACTRPAVHGSTPRQCLLILGWRNPQTRKLVAQHAHSETAPNLSVAPLTIRERKLQESPENKVPADICCHGSPCCHRRGTHDNLGPIDTKVFLSSGSNSRNRRRWGQAKREICSSSSRRQGSSGRPLFGHQPSHFLRSNSPTISWPTPKPC